MKRSYLKRKTRLAPASGKQAERLERYGAMINGWQGRRVCAKCGHKAGLEHHHPYGRGRENLFRVVLLCYACHRGCHTQADLAYSLGWLQPEYRGFIRSPNFPTPWKSDQLITDIPTP
jgi:hypothetical protein